MIQSFLCRSPQQRERASRTAISYDRLMQVVTEQAMQRAMVRINSRKSGTRAAIAPSSFCTEGRLLAFRNRLCAVLAAAQNDPRQGRARQNR